MATDNPAALPQPAPVAGRQDVLELVMADLQARREMGIAKYGTPLQTHNGRDAAMDAYQELLDLVMYSRQYLTERAEMNAALEVAAATRMGELRRSIAEIMGFDPETWPTHGNAPLAIAALVATLRNRTEGTTLVNIVFDGPPGPEAGRFVDVEDDSGRSIDVGEWLQRGDYWILQIARAVGVDG